MIFQGFPGANPPVYIKTLKYPKLPFWEFSEKSIRIGNIILLTYVPPLVWESASYVV